MLIFKFIIRIDEISSYMLMHICKIYNLKKLIRVVFKWHFKIRTN